LLMCIIVCLLAPIVIGIIDLANAPRLCEREPNFLPCTCESEGHMTISELSIQLILIGCYAVAMIVDMVINAFTAKNRSCHQKISSFYKQQDPLRFRAEATAFVLASLFYAIWMAILYGTSFAPALMTDIGEQQREIMLMTLYFFSWDIPSLIALPGVILFTTLQYKLRIENKTKTQQSEDEKTAELTNVEEQEEKYDLSRFDRDIIPMIFADSIAKDMFKEFCVRELTVSYALFYEDMMDYRKISDNHMEDRHSKSKIIIELYLIEYPTLEVNMPWKQVDRVCEQVENFEKHPDKWPLHSTLFDELTACVISNLMDSYDRFYFSEDFQKYVNEGGLSTRSNTSSGSFRLQEM
jgi:hypothetical protein